MLEVNGLQVNYGAIRAVRDVSLRVAEGELVTLLGANGAGKSSTLLAIAGALRSGGTIRVDGADVTSWTPERLVRKGIAMVPETRDVFPDLTVAENLLLGAYTRRRDSAGVASDTERMYALFPRLKERVAQAAGTLSGGEQQMLVIARALMSRPRLLLLDEPSLGLAPTIVDQIFDMIADLKRQRLTILLVEQNASKALAVADRAYVLRLGQVAVEGRAADIAAASDLEPLYLGG
ncbi:MAG TPA: ABC transporter ATP-binding protein [Geminicoccus sp.]|jgi:branched-chain amino acid transport system ATP-binding protein|uniref:ABC transporter ATP-binding protein n=1 Tax=Geminicoccus sp. TaxID=2024832 RepID=UPI002E3229F4|nr:ABC transporter ATP-binding protein [Geminicoccus sp.]HEX2528145.1 ABC transporter ATP-binding protein [Geminicoccus sp.]